jgi:peptidyl-prolyl cis-trans isomerase SurA
MKTKLIISYGMWIIMRNTLSMKQSHRFSKLTLASAILSAMLSQSVWAQTQPIDNSQIPTVAAKVMPKAVVLNRIVVVVNDDVITQMELSDRITAVERSLKAQGTALPTREELEKQLLERMIVDRVQVQMAKEQGMRVDDMSLDRALLRMAEQNKMTIQQMRNQIEREGGVFAQFREEIRNDIMMQRIREREVDSKIQVSELEVDNYLVSQDQSKNEKQEVNLAHIMVRIPENASPEIIAQRNARMQEVIKKLRIGEDFAKLAATYSDSAEALKGGEVGWREKETLPPIFSDSIAKVDVNGVSDVVRSPNGFHIFKLLGKRAMKVDAANDVVTQSNVRHILIRPTQVLTSAQIKTKLAEIKKDIISKKITFEEAAKANSVDSSAAKGGELGWVQKGDTLPEFEQAMNALVINDVSDPIETQFGIHLIQVTERKTAETSQERQRSEARQVVRARKADEALQDWIRQLRDNAYVEFRLEKK